MKALSVFLQDLLLCGLLLCSLWLSEAESLCRPLEETVSNASEGSYISTDLEVGQNLVSHEVESSALPYVTPVDAQIARVEAEALEKQMQRLAKQKKHASQVNIPTALIRLTVGWLLFEQDASSVWGCLSSHDSKILENSQRTLQLSLSWVSIKNICSEIFNDNEGLLRQVHLQVKHSAKHNHLLYTIHHVHGLGCQVMLRCYYLISFAKGSDKSGSPDRLYAKRLANSVLHGRPGSWNNAFPQIFSSYRHKQNLLP